MSPAENTPTSLLVFDSEFPTDQIFHYSVDVPEINHTIVSKQCHSNSL